MKKLIKIVVTLIIVISITNIAKAQYGNVSGLDQNSNYGIATARGTGLFNLRAQQETDPNRVDANLRTALFGNTADALTIFRGDLPGLTRRNLMDLQGMAIKQQLGSFDPTNPDKYSLQLYGVNSESEARTFWTKFDDGYVISGQRNISWCKPLNSPNYRFTPFYYAILTDTETGRSMLLRANCGNPLHLAGEGEYNETVATRTTTTTALTGPGVTVNNNIYAAQPNPNLQRQAEANTEIPRDLPKKKHGLSTGAKILIGAGAVALLYFGGKALFGKKAGGTNTTHDPNWQPPSGTPWTDGGSGDGPSW